MKKSGRNALWNGLLVEQRQALEHWLFEERLGYDEAWKRARAELGFTGSVSSLRRFYERTAQERVLAGFTSAATAVERIDGTPVCTKRMQGAGIKVVAQLFLRRVTEQPESPKEWALLAKLLLQQQDIEVRERLKTEENAIRRECLAFARERFEHDTVESALKALPELQELAEARLDPKQQLYKERKRINGIIVKLFGRGMPLHPESEEEELAQEQAKREEMRSAEFGVRNGSDTEAAESEVENQATRNAQNEMQDVKQPDDENVQPDDYEKLDELTEAAVEKERLRREREESVTRLLKESKRRGHERRLSI